MKKCIEHSTVEIVIPESLKRSREDCGEKILAGRYLLEKELGRGGFGVVYLARQIELNRRVAVKMMLSSCNDEEQYLRFMQEVNVIKQLIHPNTIQIFDAGRSNDEQIFYVMEYLEGKSLEEILRNTLFIPAERAIHIIRQVLKSLQEAHQRGIVHRDLKPQNIFIRKIIGENDFVKVLDFGIAKILDAKSRNVQQHLTQRGIVMGTPRYIAPEYFLCKEIGPHSDIYSLGLMMLKMLTGKHPIPENPVEAIKCHIMQEAIRIPPWLKQGQLGKVIKRAVEKDPKQRYSSCTQVLQDLDKISTDELSSCLKSQQSRLIPGTNRKRKKSYKPFSAKSLVLTLLILGLLTSTLIYLKFQFPLQVEEMRAPSFKITELHSD